VTQLSGCWHGVFQGSPFVPGQKLLFCSTSDLEDPALTICEAELRKTDLQSIQALSHGEKWGTFWHLLKSGYS